MPIPRAKMVGQAGEYLVCAEISELNYNCIPTNESCPYDVILDYGKLAKVQVKTSNYSPNEKSVKFAVSRRNSSNKLYKKRDADIFALVWLKGKKIAWFTYEECVGWKKTVQKDEFDNYTLEDVLSKIISLDKGKKNED